MRFFGFKSVLMLSLLMAHLSLAQGSSKEMPFTDDLSHLSLKKAENYLVSNHPQILAKVSSVESAREVYLQVCSSWMPSVDVNARYVNDYLSGNYVGSLGVSQTLFDNAAFWRLKLAKMDFALAKASLASLKNDLLYALRSSYYALIVAEQNVKASQENVDLLQASYKQEQAKFKLGETTAFQLNQSKVALSSALADLYQTRSKYKQACQGLFIAFGTEPSSKALKINLIEDEIPVETVNLVSDLLIKLESFQDEAQMSEKSLSLDNQLVLFSEELRLKYIDRAIENSPLVHISKAEEERAEMVKHSHYGEYLPSVSAFAGSSNSGDRGKNSPFEGEYNSSISVSLDWSLFDGFGRERRISQARYDKIAAEQKLRHVIYQTKQNVLNSFYQLEESLQSYVASKFNVKLAEEGVKQAFDQCSWGVISPLEYRQAVSLLTNARRDFFASAQALIQAYYLLVYNTGEDVSAEYRDVENDIRSANT